MDHDAVFEFEVLSLEHFEPALGTVVESQSPGAAWNLVRLRDVAHLLNIVLRVATHGGVQMLLRRVGGRICGVLECGCRWMRNGANVIRRVTSRAADNLSVNHC